MALRKPKPDEHPPIIIAVPAPAAASAQTPVPVPSAPESDYSGQRRLIRPNLSLRSTSARQTAAYGHGPALTAQAVQDGIAEDSSHAEVFYFQKQIQTQTRMVVVLENGVELEGSIEWYDRYAIKMRNVERGSRQNGVRTRVLVYKDSIRYIYKAGENRSQTIS